MNLFEFQIITPSKIYLTENIKQLNIKTLDGSIGILSNHSPLIGIVKISILSYFDKTNNKKSLAISEGFINVNNNKVTIVTDSVASKEEINKIKEEKDKNKYENLIKTSNSNRDIVQIELALKKAINKLKL